MRQAARAIAEVVNLYFLSGFRQPFFLNKSRLHDITEEIIAVKINPCIKVTKIKINSPSNLKTEIITHPAPPITTPRIKSRQYPAGKVYATREHERANATYKNAVKKNLISRAKTLV